MTILLGDGSSGQGDGTFTDSGENPATGSQTHSVAVGDFNSDGIQDLAVTNYGSNNMTILLGDGPNFRGDGTFDTDTTYGVGSWPYGVATADFNADGIPDLATANGASNNVSILIGNGSNGQGDGTYASAVNYSAGSLAQDVVAGDFNADGFMDLAVPNSGADNVSVFIGNGTGGQGDGTFATAVNYAAGAVSCGPIAITTGDFNADEILDLALANNDDNTVSILLGAGTGGQGDGTFGTYDGFSVGTGPVSIATGDFDADGITDIVVTNYSGSNVSVLLGNGTGGQGDGTFATHVTYSVANGPMAMTKYDFNEDGILDLAIAVNGGGGWLSILIGNGTNGEGNGTFATEVTYSGGGGPYDITTGDFNADGTEDLAIANKSDNNVSIFPGKGTNLP